MVILIRCLNSKFVLYITNTQNPSTAKHMMNGSGLGPFIMFSVVVGFCFVLFLLFFVFYFVFVFLQLWLYKDGFNTSILSRTQPLWCKDCWYTCTLSRSQDGSWRSKLFRTQVDVRTAAKHQICLVHSYGDLKTEAISSWPDMKSS